MLVRITDDFTEDCGQVLELLNVGAVDFSEEDPGLGFSRFSQSSEVLQSV